MADGTHDRRRGIRKWLCTGFRSLVWGDWGLLCLVLILYIRLPGVLRYHLGTSSHARFFVLLLLGIILWRCMVNGTKPAGWGKAARWVGGYFLVSFLSMLTAADVAPAHDTMLQLVKDVALVLVVVALFQRGPTLRRVIWTLLVAGILMGSTSVLQQITSSFEHDLWGFARVAVESLAPNTVRYRLAGPIGDANYYAQVLLVLIPLAVDRLGSQRERLWRLLAAWALLVSSLALMFTYSRGAFVGLLVVLGVMVVCRPPRFLTWMIIFLLAVPLSCVVPTAYMDHLKTFRYVVPGLGKSLLEEASFRGRFSENVVGLQMFIEHPLLGIGPGNYPRFYQRYSRHLGIDPRQEEREPHNLYIEIAAERGIGGLAVFAGLLWVLWRGMKRARMALTSAGLSDDAMMVGAFGMGLLGYLVAALFLHATYTRHFWLLVGIALAIPQAANAALTADRSPSGSNGADLVEPRRGRLSGA